MTTVDLTPFVLILILFCMGCTTLQELPPDTLKVENVWDGKRETYIFNLTGGNLNKNVRVPLWLDLAKDKKDYDKIDLFTNHIAFYLNKNEIYLGQCNVWYSGDDACYIYDIEKNTFTKPEAPCIRGSFIGHNYIDRINRKYLALNSQSEGVGTIAIITYDPKAGQKKYLEVNQGKIIFASKSDDIILIYSPCNLTEEGCQFSVDYSNKPLKKFIWSEKDGLKLKGVKSTVVPY